MMNGQKYSTLVILFGLLYLSGCGESDNPSSTLAQLNNGNGTAMISWQTTGTSIDGNCLGGTISYRLKYGRTNQFEFSDEVLIDTATRCTDSGETTACGNIMSCSYTVENLTNGTWQFAVQAYDSNTQQWSSNSNVATKSF